MVITIDCSVKKKERCTSGRAVFTLAQKNWLEYYFQVEKYITKQNRKELASSLGLTDLQVSQTPFIVIIILLLLQWYISIRISIPRSNFREGLFYFNI